MRLTSILFPLLSLATAGLCADFNTSQEFHLVTKVKPGQGDKARFDGLYVESYHTGAGSCLIILNSAQTTLK